METSIVIELSVNASVAASEALFEIRVKEIELALEVIWVLFGAILVFLIQ
jgi:hypothetical protein